jgi:NAD(P)-dependent dehydrogenase (short-subunit alcohol dehydrogenase family)
MRSFRHQVAAITGAGSGMGRALAQMLVAEGCHVAISDVNASALAETQKLLEATTTSQGAITISCHQLDVADKLAVNQFAADVVARHGKVNMVFNNAGVTVADSTEHMSDENFEWLMNINFWGVIYGTRAFLPLLSADEPGNIVNTSSIFGIVSFPGQAAYNASKFAVRGFTYALRMELANSHPHVGVTCVQPGGVKTNIVRDSRYVPSDNQAPNKEEATAAFESMAQLTSAEAAALILKAVRKNKARLLVGNDARLFALIERIMPVAYMRLLRSLLNREQARERSTP